MATVLYIHGTATRTDNDYVQSIADMHTRIEAANLSLRFDHLPWGDQLGAAWPRVFRSIPGFENQEGSEVLGAPLPNFEQDTVSTDDLEEAARWQFLYNDPLAELRLLAVERSIPFSDATILSPTSVALMEALRNVAQNPNSDLQQVLEKGLIAHAFPQAMQQIAGVFSYPESELLGNSLRTISVEDTGTYRVALARAIVATALKNLLVQDSVSASNTRDPTTVKHSALSEGIFHPLYVNPDLRDKIVRELVYDLEGNAEVLGVFTEITKGLAWLPNIALQDQRFAITGKLVRFLGDILVYQSKGDQIRAAVRAKIAAADSPVYLLAHSLGGIICVDLLLKLEASELREKVKLLITYGSQSPLFYEIKALHAQDAIGADGQLPAHFPPWLNIYDRNDLLSFQAANLFFAPRLADREVSTRSPFPFSHSAYTQRDTFWQLVFDAIRQPDDISILGLR